MSLRHRGSIALCVLVLIAVGVTACQPASELDAWTDDALVAEFERLHRPVLDLYALSPEEAEELWTLLAGSFSGEALTREFVEQLVTVAGMERDGTSVHVASVDYESVSVLERRRDAVIVEADWAVGGLVTHRAHTHPRINRYRASYTLAPSAEGPEELRLVRAEIRSLERQKRLAGRGLEARSAAGSLDLGDLLRSGLADELLAESEASTDSESSPQDQ